MTSVDDCALLELPQVPRPHGSITPVEVGVSVPFDVERVFYLYDIPAGAARAGHAHRHQEELIVCVMGSFTVTLKDGSRVRRLELNRAHVGLHLVPMVWCELDSFSAGSIAVVLASGRFDESDYLRAFAEFEHAKRASG